MQKKFSDGDFVTSWYQDLVNQYGLDIRSLGYNHKESQTKRFHELMKLGEFEGKSVLDVGCGLGDFLDYLMERKIDVDYTGIDLVPDMIRQCKNRFRDRIGKNAEFEATDTLEYMPRKAFDYVVASGIFGLLTEDMQERIAPTLARLFSWAKTGVAVNFLSAKSPRPAEGKLYVEPARILGLALDLTPAVELTHSYLPNDFTVFLYRSPAWKNGSENVSVGDGMKNGAAAEPVSI